MEPFKTIESIILSLWIFISGTGGQIAPRDIPPEPQAIVIEEQLLEKIDIYEEIEVELVEEAGPTFNYLGTYKVTGYDNCAGCCGIWAGGPTASGVIPQVEHTVAMCSNYPFGTRIYIEGLGYYTVEDRGVGEGKIDIYVNNHSEAYALTGWYEVWEVIE